MRRGHRPPYFEAAVAIGGASFTAVLPVAAPISAVQERAVQLTSGDSADSLLGDGTALIMGGSGVPTPPQTYGSVASAGAVSA